MVTHPQRAKVLRSIHYLANRLREDRLTTKAAALTFVSLFALVPLLTVTLSIASALPAAGNIEEKLSDFLLQFLLPESSSQVVQYLSAFINQARSLTLFGVAILVVTAVLMLRNVEAALNEIWQNRANRRPMQSVLLYWTVLSLGPIAIGLGLGARAYLFAVTNEWAGLDVLGLGTALIGLLPFILSTMGLTCLYMLVPNCQVPWRHALAGGVFAAITFTIARAIFTTVMSKSSYTLVYGAFAAVPLFLLWIYITWIIVLAGALLTHGLSAYQSSEQERTPMLIKALDTLYLFWRAQQDGRALSDLDVIGTNDWSSDALDADSWRLIRDRLSETNVLKKTDRGRYLLCRDLHTISLADLTMILRAEPEFPRLDTGPVWRQTASSMLARQMEQEAQDLAPPLSLLCASTDA